MTSKLKIVASDGVTILAETEIGGSEVLIRLRAQPPTNCLLHWGLRRRSGGDWRLPDSDVWPPGSTSYHGFAIQTPLLASSQPCEVCIRCDVDPECVGLEFALCYPEISRWDNNHGRNFLIPLPQPESTNSVWPSFLVAQTAEEIIHHELHSGSWTLMHRFRLCHDLLTLIPDQDVDALQLLYVWMRLSAMRQLTWQRNYNTQPRELSHAQDRLTQLIADRYVGQPAERHVLRLLATTLGRGGDGQRIRDEILQIMHRNHVKEVHAHFLEQWHQKLHNNTTPDDVVICEAYIAFLRDNGNLQSFYHHLTAGGVTPERLRSYDRPIRVDPEFLGDRKDALLADFGRFLGTLKAVHSATDLGSAIQVVGAFLPNDAHQLLQSVWNERHASGSSLLPMLSRLLLVRFQLVRQMDPRTGHARDLLSLDLALEDFFRLTVERNIHLLKTHGEQVELLNQALHNVCLSIADEELLYCRDHWSRLRGQLAADPSQWLHAWAVLERISRTLAAWADGLGTSLQTKALALGKRLGIDPWALEVFAEEVVRGRLEFVVSALVSDLAPSVRVRAGAGPWLLASRGHGAQHGRLTTTEELRLVQGHTFGEPIALLADRVDGDEEIPAGVRVLLTTQPVDVMSHVAVRARNAGVLLATCLDSQQYARLKNGNGKLVSFLVTPDGGVEASDYQGDSIPESVPKRAEPARLAATPAWAGYVVSAPSYDATKVGAKALNLANLRGKLPEWIHIPTSIAIPFAVFPRVLEDKSNQPTAEWYSALAVKAQEANGAELNEILAQLRAAVCGLHPPTGLAVEFENALQSAHLPKPGSFEQAWTCIRRVWASKWNARAFFSRRANAIAHDQLLMSVLVQEAVPAEYAFVVHTTNPLSDNPNELYAEVVAGLGETLVGNQLGSAFGFCWNKATAEARIVSFPSKSCGLYGGRLVFRSDSNAEDLAAYAGAGLYDSVFLPEPQPTILNYSNEPICWDVDERLRMMTSIAHLAHAVEVAFTTAQDIEGCCAEGKYFVVQSRPQVGVHDV